MTLVGFVFTYPQSLSTPAARSAIDLSISVFDIFGNGFAVAAGAANIMRDLCVRIDFLIGQSQAKQVISSSQEAADEMSLATNFGASDEHAFTHNGFSISDSVNGDLSFYDMTDIPNQDLFDSALAIDFWGDMETLWPDTGALPEYYALTQ